MRDDGLGVFDQALPFILIARHDFIRVEAVRHRSDAQVGLQARFVFEQAARVETEFALAVHGGARGFKSAQDGFLSCGIRVERQHNAP